MKVKNDVDNSVDNVENVTQYCAFSDMSSLIIAKKAGVILGEIAKNMKKILNSKRN